MADEEHRPKLIALDRRKLVFTSNTLGRYVSDQIDIFLRLQVPPMCEGSPNQPVYNVEGILVAMAALHAQLAAFKAMFNQSQDDEGAADRILSQLQMTVLDRKPDNGDDT